MERTQISLTAESLAVARRRFGVEGAMALIDDLLPAIDILTVEPAVRSAAMTRYRDSLPSGTSFVDQGWPVGPDGPSDRDQGPCGPGGLASILSVGEPRSLETGDGA